MGTYYTSVGKEVTDGNTALADDLNNINDAVDSGFDAVDTAIQNVSTDASGWADEAEKWAEEAEDVEVEAGKYSALHHAAKASASATTASNAATTASNAATTASNAATTASNAASSASASAGAASTSETNAATSETNAAASAATIPSPTASKHGALIYQNDTDDGYDKLDTQGSSGDVLISGGADAAVSWATRYHAPAPTPSKYGALVVQADDDASYTAVTSQGTSGQVLTSNGADALPSFQDASPSLLTLPTGVELEGGILGYDLELNTVAPTTDIDVGAGSVWSDDTDPSNRVEMKLATGYTLETDKALGIDNGCMSSTLNSAGHPNASTIYHLFVLSTSDGATVKIGMDSQVDGSTLVTDHGATYPKMRYLWSWRFNTSAQLCTCTQSGDWLYYNKGSECIAATGLSNTTYATRSLTGFGPSNRMHLVLMGARQAGGSGAHGVYFSIDGVSQVSAAIVHNAQTSTDDDESYNYLDQGDRVLVPVKDNQVYSRADVSSSLTYAVLSQAFLIRR